MTFPGEQRGPSCWRCWASHDTIRGTNWPVRRSAKSGTEPSTPASACGMSMGATSVAKRRTRTVGGEEALPVLELPPNCPRNGFGTPSSSSFHGHHHETAPVARKQLGVLSTRAPPHAGRGTPGLPRLTSWHSNVHVDQLCVASNSRACFPVNSCECAFGCECSRAEPPRERANSSVAASTIQDNTTFAPCFCDGQRHPQPFQDQHAE